MCVIGERGVRTAGAPPGPDPVQRVAGSGRVSPVFMAGAPLTPWYKQQVMGSSQSGDERPETGESLGLLSPEVAFQLTDGVFSLCLTVLPLCVCSDLFF